MFDAHVHVGYYTRFGCETPFYYSPRRVVGTLTRCGVNEFIVSSTCAQVAEIPLADILREAREMKRVAGARAHQFFWLAGRFYDADRDLKVFDTGLYEGIKLHELETPWNGRRKRDLERILAIAAERGLAVQMHSGGKNCMPLELAKWAEKFPTVRFDFAHCCPIDDMAKVVAEHPNVWTDCGLWQNNDWRRLGDYDWHGRLMFGSDFPAYHARFAGGFTDIYRELLNRFDSLFMRGNRRDEISEVRNICRFSRL